MAVEVSAAGGSEGGTGRRVLVGTNVAVATAVLIAVAAVAQYIAYIAPVKFDMTSSGINSLGSGTVNLLSGLDTNVRLTSLYFKTDLEDEDQQRYRRSVDDLLGLYASTNRSKVSADWINPLADHEKLKKLTARLRALPAWKDELEAYKTSVDQYRKTFDPDMRQLVQKELDQIAAVGGAMQDPNVQKAIAPVEELLTGWVQSLEETRAEIDALATEDNPQYSAAVRELKTLYKDFSKTLNDIAGHGRNVIKQIPQMSGAQAGFLSGAGGRYASLLPVLEQEMTRLNGLKALKMDDIVREMTPNGNAILVETDQDARIVDFSSVWPPLDPNAGGRRLAFKDRAFKGEEKITSAILRTTHKEQTAVIFVRFGGAPLFFGGFMPGQPPAPYAQMKAQLEDANFVVEEWDVKTKETPPELDPKPTRTLYVVLKPTTPERNPMMGQQGQDPPISEAQKKAVLNAIGDNGRALFIVGWHPGPFPGAPIPATYEYADHLKKNWGISINTELLLMQTSSIAPGKYGVTRRDWFNMRDLEVTSHDIVKGPQGSRLAFPWCAPLELAAAPPTGVEYFTLVNQPPTDGVWGIKNIQAYQDQQDQQQFLSRLPDDKEGPFLLAVAAKKSDGRVVVVGSRDFANDQVAFAQDLGLTSQGFTMRARNPGNVTLLINSMHWLNDNMRFLDIGRPIDAAVLEIPKSGATMTAVKALTIFVWPALALVCGGAVWWVRRR